MESVLNSLYQNLQKLIGLHRQLLDGLRLEHEALMASDLKGIQDATYSKEALLSTIHQVERERIKLIQELSLYFKRDTAKLTMSELILEVQSKDRARAEQFRSIFNTLNVLVKHVIDQNDENRALVDNGMFHVQEMKKNALGEHVQRNDRYSAKGTKINSSSEGRLISREI